jgi:glycosyltransferase involved in cell wall biosynthesis
VLRSLQRDDPTLRILELTKNYGQSSAIAAGLDHCRGEVTVLIDSDLQDRPEDIPKLLDAMVEKKVPMAISRRATRDEPWLKIAVSNAFHRVANRISGIRQPLHLGVFRAIHRDLVDELHKLPETSAPPLSLLSWMGHRFAVVDTDRDARYAGKSGYTIAKMVSLALDRIFSYSLFPIRLATLCGVLLSLASFGLIGFFLVRWAVLDRIVPGWTSLMVTMLFLSGVNLLFLGIIGEYLWRTFLETKRRPRYVVRRFREPPRGDTPPRNAAP